MFCFLVIDDYLITDERRGKKDLSDLTNTIMGDVQVTEQMFSHYVPQFYGSVISTCLVAVSLLFYDWQMALAALWVLPVALEMRLSVHP